MGGASTLLVALFLLFIPTSISAHNITAILSGFSQYTSFNSYLTQTKLSDDINNRQPVTVLAVTDAAFSTLVSKHPIPVIKHALSLHVLLDYFDGPKLHKLSNGSVLSTTLYQTTGTAQGQLGFVNITDRKKGGKVCFGSGVPGSPLDSTYTKEVKKFPYSLSIVEISQPIIVPGIMSAPAPSASEVNITSLLIHAGCKTFAGYVSSTGMIKTYQAAANKALTVFAPNDEAFKVVAGIPDLSKLTNAELVSLLQYHALPSYDPIGTLKSAKAPLATLATSGGGKYVLRVTTAGDEVTLHAGLDSSRVATTVMDTTPLCVFTVDSLLLPTELFGNAPSTAPAGEPVASPSTAPAPVVEVPSPAPVQEKSPAPSLSPLAPPAESPEGSSPADAPSEEEADSALNNSPGGMKASTFINLLLTVSATVICSFLLY